MSEDVDIDAIMAGIVADEEPTVVHDMTAEEDLQSVVDEIEEDALDTLGEKAIDTIDLEDDNALSNRIVQNSLNVITNAKMVFENFSVDVFHGADKSTSSKETLIKALDVQNAANKNMIDLAKVLSAKSDKGTNILINTVSEKQAGISLNNIKASL